MTDQRPIGFWLALVDRMLEERFAATLDEHGVTRRQWQLLAVLLSGPATVETLDADGGEPAAEQLTELIDSGWADATAAGYELTERGRGAVERLAAVVSANRDLALAGIPPADYDAVLATLERIAQNLGWSGE